MLAAAVVYCMTRQCEKDSPMHYCHGCTLRRIHDNISFDDYLKGRGIAKGSTHESTEYDYWFGKEGWEIALKIYCQHFNELFESLQRLDNSQNEQGFSS